MSVLGIHGERWKRIASFSPWLLGLEERSEGRSLYAHVHQEKKLLIQIQDDVAKHEVTKALRKLHKWDKEAGKGEEKGEQLAMSQTFQYFHVVRITKHFVDILGKFMKDAEKGKGDEYIQRVKEIARDMTKKMITAMKQAEAWGGEDVRTIMAIINDSRNKRPAEFIAAIRQWSKNEKNVSVLGRIPLRMDVKEEIRDESYLKRLAKELESLDEEVSRGKIKSNRLLDKFGKIIYEGGHDLAEMFKAAHLVMKRDLLLIIMIIIDVRMIKELGAEWVQEHFMPEEPVTKEEINIKKMSKKLSEKAQILANGLGVIVKKEKEVDRALTIELSRIR